MGSQCSMSWRKNAALVLILCVILLNVWAGTAQNIPSFCINDPGHPSCAKHLKDIPSSSRTGTPVQKPKSPSLEVEHAKEQAKPRDTIDIAAGATSLMITLFVCVAGVLGVSLYAKSDHAVANKKLQNALRYGNFTGVKKVDVPTLASDSTFFSELQRWVTEQETKGILLHGGVQQWLRMHTEMLKCQNETAKEVRRVQRQGASELSLSASERKRACTVLANAEYQLDAIKERDCDHIYTQWAVRSMLSELVSTLQLDLQLLEICGFEWIDRRALEDLLKPLKRGLHDSDTSMDVSIDGKVQKDAHRSPIVTQALTVERIFDTMQVLVADLDNQNNEKQNEAQNELGNLRKQAVSLEEVWNELMNLNVKLAERMKKNDVVAKTASYRKLITSKIEQWEKMLARSVVTEQLVYKEAKENGMPLLEAPEGYGNAEAIHDGPVVEEDEDFETVSTASLDGGQLVSSTSNKNGGDLTVANAMDRRTATSLYMHQQIHEMGLRSLEEKRQENMHRESSNRIFQQSVQVHKDEIRRREEQYEQEKEAQRTLQQKATMEEERRLQRKRKVMVETELSNSHIRLILIELSLMLIVFALNIGQWFADHWQAWHGLVINSCFSSPYLPSLDGLCRIVYYGGLVGLLFLVVAGFAVARYILSLIPMPATLSNFLVACAGVMIALSSGYELNLAIIMSFALFFASQWLLFYCFAWWKVSYGKSRFKVLATVSSSHTLAEMVQHEEALERLDRICDFVVIMCSVVLLFIIFFLFVQALAPVTQREACAQVWRWYEFAQPKLLFTKIGERPDGCLPIKRVAKVLF